MIRFSDEAREDVDRLFTWLAVRSPSAATRFLQTLSLTTKGIAEQPLLHPIAEEDTELRKCLMRFGKSAYVIYYSVEGDRQTVVRMWHGREDRR